MDNNRLKVVDEMTLEEIENEINIIRSELNLEYYNLGKTIYDYADGALREIGNTVNQLVILKRKRQQLIDVNANT